MKFRKNIQILSLSLLFTFSAGISLADNQTVASHPVGDYYGKTYIPVSREEIIEDFKYMPEKSGGVYLAYPDTKNETRTELSGYTPFYISHYGRHGSRYLIADNDYKWLIDLFAEARQHDALTALGVQVAARLDSVWQEAEGRGGELTPLGQRQHYSIGRNMATHFPEVFAKDAHVKARSTVVMRCAMSMSACVDGITSQFPELFIPKESGERNMYYLNYHDEKSRKFTSHNSPWRSDYNRYVMQHTDGRRLASTLFKPTHWTERNVNADRVLEGLYWVAVDMQNMESTQNFFDLFTTEELYDRWLCTNLNFYICDSNYAGNDRMLLNNARPLVNDILTCAQQIIDDNAHGADLRFGHDGNIIPLAGLLGIENCANSVADFDSVPGAFRVHEISPMASNLQLVFFRPKKKKATEENIIVKVMLNEREVAIPGLKPVSSQIENHYTWATLKQHLQSLLETAE